MSLPIVKLVDKNCKTYTYTFGNREYGFRQGVSESVSVHLALRLRKILNRKGNGIFKIINLPEVIVRKGEQVVSKRIFQHLLFST